MYLVVQGCKASYPDLTTLRSHHHDAYSPFLPACIGGGGDGGGVAPDACSCGHVDTSSSHVSSSRDEDSPDTPLVSSEDGRSSSSSHHHHHPPPPSSPVCLVSVDRESAV